MFQSDDSDAIRKADQGSETRSKRTVGSQSSLLACPHPGKAWTRVALKGRGDGGEGNAEVHLHVVNAGKRTES